MEHKWDLGIQNCKNQKIKTELGHSDVLSVYKPSFAQMLISQENMNVFWSDLITVVLNGTISYLCKLTIQDGRQAPLLKIAGTRNDNISRTIC